ncbi:MAG: rhodanese-like domain-containing protein [Bryobacteraceae bacterium]
MRNGSFVMALAAVGVAWADGADIYTRLCAGCHGDDGEAVSYPNVIPVAGIGRRYRPDEIARRSGSFSGRNLSERDRAEVVRYMMTLGGAKGYRDAGWLMLPHLLEQKSQRIAEFRVIDARSAAAYAAGHVPNAVQAGAQACVEDPARTAEWMGAHGIGRETVVVVYDEVGGPAAACVWWRLRRAGHPWVAVLDGGWRRWMAEGRAVDRTTPRIEPVEYGPVAPVTEIRTQGGRAAAWRWEAAVDDRGMARSERLESLTAAIRAGGEWRWTGAEAELAHLALCVALSGVRIDYDAANGAFRAVPESTAEPAAHSAGLSGFGEPVTRTSSSQ